MKINQLFVKRIEPELVVKLLNCFGLQNLDDHKSFTKHDLIANQVSVKVEELLPELSQYYLPCKARVYLNNISERRALTILRQVVRLYDHFLSAREKNINSHKVIVYQLSSGVSSTLIMTNQPMRIDFT
jgi:hypothetical protein